MKLLMLKSSSAMNKANSGKIDLPIQPPDPETLLAEAGDSKRQKACVCRKPHPS
jgi:hypothetical protein